MRRTWLPRIGSPISALRPTAAPTVVGIAPPDGASRLALVVEDEASLRKLTERILVRAGWSVLTADCGESAIELLPKPGAQHASPLAVVISDVVMPGMDGLELVRAVRRVWPRLPAILVSGFAEASMTRDLAAEAIAFLAKPYSPKDLVALVQRTTEQNAPSGS